MKQPIFVQNTPIDEKRIAFIEKVVTRLARRSRKKTTAIITPYPISNCMIGEDIKGDILKYLFVDSGTITKGMVWLGATPKNGVTVLISIDNDFGNSGKSYNVSRRDFLMDPNIEVQSGDRLTVSIYPINPEEDKITEVWIAFKWVPNVKDTKVKQFLIDELEKDDSV